MRDVIKMAEPTCERLLNIAADELYNEKKYLNALSNLNDAMDLFKKEKPVMKLKKDGDRFASLVEHKILGMLADCYLAVRNKKLFCRTIARDLAAYYSLRTDYMNISLEFVSGQFYTVDDAEDLEYIFGALSSYDEIMLYERVYNEILNRDYDKGMEILDETPYNYCGYERLRNLAFKATELDGGFDMFNDRFGPGRFTFADFLCGDRNARFRDAMFMLLHLLNSNNNDSVPFLKQLLSDVLDSDSEDLIIAAGCIFFNRGFYDMANSFFERALKLNPMNEEALFYSMIIMATVGSSRRDSAGDKNKFVRYWNRYENVVKNCELPLKLIREGLMSISRGEGGYKEIFESGDSPKLTAYYNKIMEKLGTSPKTPFRELKDFLKIVANDEMAGNVIDAIGKLTSPKPWIIEALIEVLRSYDASVGLKIKIVRYLAGVGYSGPLVTITPYNIVLFTLDCPPFPNETWKKLFLTLLIDIVFGRLTVPLKCGVLADACKKLSQLFDPEKEDGASVLLLLACEYIEKAGVNIAVSEFLEKDVVRGKKINVEKFKNLVEKYGFACFNNII